MANFGYCRFRNTLEDLEDCYDHLLDGLGSEEREAREELVALCKVIVRTYEREFPAGEEDEDEDEEQEEEE